MLARAEEVKTLFSEGICVNLTVDFEGRVSRVGPPFLCWTDKTEKKDGVWALQEPFQAVGGVCEQVCMQAAFMSYWGNGAWVF